MSPNEVNLKKNDEVNIMLICFYVSKGIIHKEFVPCGVQRLILCITWAGCIEPFAQPYSLCTSRARQLYDNTPAHRATNITHFFCIKNQICITMRLIHHGLSPCDYFRFHKLHLAIKENPGLHQLKM